MSDTETVDGAAYFAAQRLRWTERQFQDEVLKLARDHGWAHRYHTHDSRASAAGFPDLVLVRSGRIIFAELKAMKGKLGDAQVSWLKALCEGHEVGGGGVSVHEWRPCCWNSGEIEKMLA